MACQACPGLAEHTGPRLARVQTRCRYQGQASALPVVVYIYSRPAQVEQGIFVLGRILKSAAD